MSKRSLDSDDYRDALEEERNEVAKGVRDEAGKQVVEIEDDEEEEEEEEVDEDEEGEEEDDDDEEEESDDEGEDETDELLQVARVLNGDRRKKIVVTVVFGGRTHCRNRETSAHCQVDGCDADLQEAKAYHRKHRVCEAHAKATSVLIGGVEMRYCQQCSRFHEISQFDGPRRSCRLRLAGHNERRRKMCPDSINGIAEEPSCAEEPPSPMKPNQLQFG